MLPDSALPQNWRAGLRRSRHSHDSAHPLGRMFPLLSAGFLDAKGFTAVTMFQRTEKARM